MADVDPLELLFLEITNGPNGIDLDDFLLFLRRKAAADQFLDATLQAGESLLAFQNLERESGLSPALTEALNAKMDRAGVILEAIIRERMPVDDDSLSEEEGDGDDESSNAMSVDLHSSSSSSEDEEEEEEEEEEEDEDRDLKDDHYHTTRYADEEPEYNADLPVSRPHPYPCERRDGTSFHGDWEVPTARMIHPQHYPLPGGCSAWHDFVVYSVADQRWNRIGEGLNLVGRSSVLLFRRLTLLERECPGLDLWLYLINKGTGFLSDDEASDDEDMEELQSDVESVTMTIPGGDPGSSFNDPLIIN
ncbi:hypothetical protein C8F04DRAFT_1187351 [Mycena alexandri]|uniref:Uncharacterized protein n=1 Tax=Mycena alexandri TaxID=1745969 RepID=A0AAD6X034_9AGAR|nr:hypothetical protein C8F04DRAFT_1187351 [Mycena alexandri]